MYIPNTVELSDSVVGVCGEYSNNSKKTDDSLYFPRAPRRLPPKKVARRRKPPRNVSEKEFRKSPTGQFINKLASI